jgi:hypothetical protein
MAMAESVEGAREELAKISSLVLTARRLLAGGTLVDVTAVAERVRAVCQTIDALPKDDGLTLLPDVEGLMARLDMLETDLNAHLARVRSLRTDGGD